MIQNIIFAGTPKIAAQLLADLIDAKYNISACFTRPDQPSGRSKKIIYSAVKEQAIQHNIAVFQPEKLNNPATIQLLSSLQPDLMLVFAYGLILPKDILSIPKFGCFNVHTSLLPQFRGAAPIQHTILSGNTRTGISIIKMSTSLDSGDLCYQRSCPVAITETSESLIKKLQPLATQATISVLEQLNTNSIKFTQQDHSQATYAHKIHKIEAKINWNQETIKIERMIRAFIPAPIAFTAINDLAIRIWQAKILNNFPKSSLPPGSIKNFTKDGIDVVTKDGILRIEKLQLPGGKVLSSNELFNSTKYKNFFTTCTLLT